MVSQSNHITLRQAQDDIMNTSVNLAGIQMKNPVATASGTFGYGFDMAKLWDISVLGALVVKSIALKPWKGAPTPRIAETASGMLNAIGLQNPGVEKFVSDYLPQLRKYSMPIIVNVVENTIDGFCEVVDRLNGIEGIAGIEVNASCPNYQGGNLPFCSSTPVATELTKKIKERTKLPILIKLSPNVTDIVSIAKAVEDAGADGIAMINTLIGMKIDLRTCRPFIGFKTGGLSGPAIKPVAVRMVWQAAQAVKIPILGMGGIMNGEDAIEFIMAGATAIAVGTANFTDPWACPRIIKEIEAWMQANGVKDINELRGMAFRNS